MNPFYVDFEFFLRNEVLKVVRVVIMVEDQEWIQLTGVLVRAIRPNLCQTQCALRVLFPKCDLYHPLNDLFMTFNHICL